MATKKIAAPVFTTKRVVADRMSAPVVIKALHFDTATRSIKAFCDDGFTRECRVDRLTDIETGRKLWVMLEQITKDGKTIRFQAAGGFSPDRWFYTASAYEAPKDGMPF